MKSKPRCLFGNALKLIGKACLGVLVTSLTSSAQPAAPGTGKPLSGHVPEVVSRLTSTGRLPLTNELRLAIGLSLRNREALTNLLEQIYDPASPNYHHYLTPAEFTANFGPTETDYQALVTFAKANGLTVTATHPNRVLLDVRGAVADVEKALHLTMRVYPHPKEARSFFAPDVEPSLDLAVPVLQISGLDNYYLPRPHLQASLVAKAHNARPNAGSGPGGTYMGNDFRAAYVPGSPLNGSGQTVGLLQFDGYTASDITYYESNAGLSSITVTNVLLDGVSGLPSGGGGEVEVSLDIEMAMSMAPGLSQIIVYEGADWHDILNRMATDDLAKQLSCSWYISGGGPDPVADEIWQQMAVQGQSFFNASGDYGAYTGPIDFPGDTPFITQVGGTTLTTSGPGGDRVSETVWNWNNGIASGGGVSTSYPIPSWQTGFGMTANNGSTTQRNTPDVALTADNVYVRVDGQDDVVGGTSCASPLWAGFMSLINQQAAANGQPSLGFINPAIYALGRQASYTLALHDITTGSNATPFSPPSMFPAVSGYDLCTGWGTPNGSNLVNALVAPGDTLRISPGLGFIAVGQPGGPFIPNTQNYSLKNTGTGALNWTLANVPTWLTATATSGQLKPGGPALPVTIGLNSAASNLLVGTYVATLWFTNLNDAVGQSRQFTLQVSNMPVVITQQPTNLAIVAGGTAAFKVGATGTGLHYYWQKNGGALTNGGNISGSASSTLTVSNATAADAGIYSVIVSNVLGSVSSSGAGLTIYSLGGGQIVQNGGFETGDFSGWLLSGNSNLMMVTTDSIAVHSAAHGAQCGPGGSLGILSQTLSTVPGAAYLISVWLDSPDGAAPNEFMVEWNGSVLYDAANLAALNWTNLQFLVNATGTSTVLAFGFRDDPSYLGLDDVTVTGFTNVASPPLIVTQPSSQTVSPGGTAVFNVTATGSGPLSYCWLRNGIPIVGATQPGYTDNQVQLDAGSQFSCLVSNAYGTILSSTVLLTVAGPVHLFTGPDGGFLCSGLVQDASGNFYGTTEYGGASGYGTVFKMGTNGTLVTLVSFGFANGIYPIGGLALGTDGNLYGTTSGGGSYGEGTVFKMTTDGILTTLVSFNYSVNGTDPTAALVQGMDGSFYGTTADGGTNYDGTVFKVTTNGTLTTLVSFNDTNGAYPYAGLVQGTDGNLYGTTAYGGLNSDGTIFRITTNGTLTTLVSFNYINGSYPYAGLVQGTDGNFYGTTEGGGLTYNGTVFRMTTNGTLTTLVSFSYTNGANPEAGLMQGADGNLYGTTSTGGSSQAGTVFRLASDGTLATLISFSGRDGALPQAALLQGMDGNLYGTTADGGFGYNGNLNSGDGTIFGILLAPTTTQSSPAIIAQPVDRTVSIGGSATFSVQAEATAPVNYYWQRNGLPIAGAKQSSYTASNVQLADSGNQFTCLASNAAGVAISSNALLTVLAPNTSGPVFSFSGFDGGFPAGLALGANGNFYGTTEYGDVNAYGTIFVITPDGLLTNLASFNYTDGANPEAGVVPGHDGNLYGTTSSGGYYGYGTVFKMTTNGSLTTLVSFNYTDGANPSSGLMQGADGNLYGTTAYGGLYYDGTVFRITTDGSLTTLVSFNNTNGAYPEAGLVQGTDGNFYGTTSQGGTNDDGTVFKMTADGTFSTLVSFNYTNGENPNGALVQGTDGNLYGTTAYGGLDYGTIFRMTTNGPLTTLVSFNYANGSYPYAGLVQGADGSFYGTTQWGGASGYGTVFRMSGDGTLLTNLWSFAGPNGRGPLSALASGADGNFYGTAPYGGAGYDGNYNSGNGVIFRIAVLSTVGPPQITAQPASPTVAVGGTANFSVGATGSTPLSYFWMRNGKIITGANSSTYSTNNVQLTDSGSQFSCVVSNAYGTTNSQTATLHVNSSVNLVQNGGFETGDFTGWSGSMSGASVTSGSIYVHSGAYGANLGPVGALGYLYQTFTTVAGSNYLVSLWLENLGGAPNEFQVTWNGHAIFDGVNLAAFSWTNLQFFVAATGASTTLQFGFRQDPSYFGLDDVSVTMASAVAVAPVITHVMLLPGGNIQMTITGFSDDGYSVLGSTNLLTWQTIASVTNFTGTVQFTDPGATNHPQSFYRLVTP